MHTLIRASIALLALMITACGTPTTPSGASQAPQASTAPSSTAAQASARESAAATSSAAPEPSTAAEASAAAAGTLQGTAWQWVSLVDPTQEITVDNPPNYTLSFGADDTLAIRADCNQASGTYQAGADGSLTISVGPTTLVGCPPGSRGDEYLEQLGFVTRYFLEGGELKLEMMADGGTLTFEAQ